MEATPIQAMEAEDSQEQDAKNRENMRVRSFITFFLACMGCRCDIHTLTFLYFSFAFSFFLSFNSGGAVNDCYGICERRPLPMRRAYRKRSVRECLVALVMLC